MAAEGKERPSGGWGGGALQSEGEEHLHNVSKVMVRQKKIKTQK